MTLPLLVGEAPSRGGDRYHMLPLSGPPARVLCVLAGIPPQEDGSTYGRWTWALYERFECRNLLERHGNAEPWSAPRATACALALRPEMDGRVVVCLGRRVYAAVWASLGMLRATAADFNEWRHASEASSPGPRAVAAIPHPSGLNRTLNDPGERERAGKTLRVAMELALVSSASGAARA